MEIKSFYYRNQSDHEHTNSLQTVVDKFWNSSQLSLENEHFFFFLCKHLSTTLLYTGKQVV